MVFRVLGLQLGLLIAFLSVLVVLSYARFCFLGCRYWGYLAFAFYRFVALSSLLLGWVCFLLVRYTGLV